MSRAGPAEPGTHAGGIRVVQAIEHGQCFVPGVSGRLVVPGRIVRVAEAAEQALDQCWDRLRQRRARREFGQSPEEAQVRPASEVEGYRQ